MPRDILVMHGHLYGWQPAQGCSSLWRHHAQVSALSHAQDMTSHAYGRLHTDAGCGGIARLHILRLVTHVGVSRVALVSLQDMTSHAYGNPHTDAGGGGPAGSTVLIEHARSETLAMCNVSSAEYECVFTSGATGEDSFPTIELSASYSACTRVSGKTLTMCIVLSAEYECVFPSGATGGAGQTTFAVLQSLTCSGPIVTALHCIGLAWSGLQVLSPGGVCVPLCSQTARAGQAHQQLVQ